jgi:hypothetical protein
MKEKPMSIYIAGGLCVGSQILAISLELRFLNLQHNYIGVRYDERSS